jgi:broad specificity phosphatase PhoE
MSFTPKTWYIFRHGLATRSKNGYGDRVYTAELLPEGIPPIQRLGAYLKPMPCDAAWRSEFLRCQQTAGIVSEATARVFTPDARLNENVEEAHASVVKRVTEFVAEVNATQHQHVWVCTHGYIIAALRALLTSGSFPESVANDYTQTGQLLIIQPTTEQQVIDFNTLV